MPKFYRDVEVKSKDYPGRLYFTPYCNGDELTEDAARLLREISQVEESIVYLYQDEKSRKSFFPHLEDIARIGLVGENPRPNDVKCQLENLKDRIFAHAFHKRNEYLRALVGINMLLILFAIVCLFAAEIDWIKSFGIELSHNLRITIAFHDPSFLDSITYLVKAFLYGVLRVSISTCIAAFLRLREMTFEDIKKISLYSLSPLMLILFLIMLSCVLIALLFYGLIQVGLFGTNLGDIKTKPHLGFLVGLLCGLAEPATSKLLTKVAPTGT